MIGRFSLQEEVDADDDSDDNVDDENDDNDDDADDNGEASVWQCTHLPPFPRGGDKFSPKSGFAFSSASSSSSPPSPPSSAWPPLSSSSPPSSAEMMGKAKRRRLNTHRDLSQLFPSAPTQPGSAVGVLDLPLFVPLHHWQGGGGGDPI